MKKIVSFALPAVFLVMAAGCSSHSATSTSSEHTGAKTNSSETNSSETNSSNTDQKQNASTGDLNSGDHQTITNSDDQSSSTSSANGSGDQKSPASSKKNRDTDSDDQKSSSSQSNRTDITSGSSAIEHLKSKLKMENQDDIVFDDMGGDLETDGNGSFYTVELTSKSLRKNGGSGTVGLYKVYQDGTYKEKK
ncbi:hypothetical protein [Bacillus sp. TH008]|uniref:hypothetical protein n=1 Tax=Bacillus sp. TH008 TaxID=1609979 RepID=UPI0006996483|nr:hypothetical protein [Bacillus sp. TH008]